MIIYGSPQRYVQGPGVFNTIGMESKRLGNKAALVADARLMALLGDIAKTSCAAHGVELQNIVFAGEITHQEINRLATELASGTDLVIAVGGGKSIDVGKALGQGIGARLITVPTAASNDAPTSHIFVVYDENHRSSTVGKCVRNPDTVLVDTAIIAKAPARLFTAGIGDAIVKRFEVQQCIGANGTNVYGGTPSLTSLAIAHACYDTLRKNGLDALNAVKAGKVTPALESVVEATVLMSGISFESGGLSISHAMTRGLTAVRGASNALHGHQVAYGLLVQLYLEGQPDQFQREILQYYGELDLPTRLAHLGMTEPTDQEIGMIADLTFAAPHIRHFKRTLSSADIGNGIKEIESRTAD